MKGENSVKLFGNDLEEMTKTAFKIKDVLNSVEGVTDLAVLTSLGQPTVTIKVDRAKAARYGLMRATSMRRSRPRSAGQPAGDLYERGSDRHFPIGGAPSAAISRKPRCHSQYHSGRARHERDHPGTAQ